MKRTAYVVIALSLVTLALAAGVGWCIFHAPSLVPTIPFILTAIAAVIGAIGGTGGTRGTGGAGSSSRRRR